LKVLPPQLPDITWESSVQILSVALSNIRRIVSESAQTLYAL